jgi:hypothetical protein
MKTIQCPSCGAQATNLRNCEFCGSLFVRYEQNNLELATLFDNEFKFIGFVYPGLENELRNNLDIQTNSSFIVTDILYKNEVLLQIVQTTGLDNLLGNVPKSYPGLAVHVPFTEDRELEYNRFVNLPEHKLFHSTYSEGIHDFTIDFGNDSKGAAYLASLYLQKQEGLSENVMLTYSTSDYSNSGTKEKTNCFIATATMGDYDNHVVVDLRTFRDKWLLQRNWGVKFTNWYYKKGPCAARAIERFKLLKIISFIFIVKPLQIIVNVFKLK